MHDEVQVLWDSSSHFFVGVALEVADEGIVVRAPLLELLQISGNVPQAPEVFSVLMFFRYSRGGTIIRISENNNWGYPTCFQQAGIPSAHS